MTIIDNIVESIQGCFVQSSRTRLHLDIDYSNLGNRDKGSENKQLNFAYYILTHSVMFTEEM